MCTIMMNWFTDEYRSVFGFKKDGYRRWTRDRCRAKWDEASECQRATNGVSAETEQRFNTGARDMLLYTRSPYK